MRAPYVRDAARQMPIRWAQVNRLVSRGRRRWWLRGTRI